MSEEGLRGDGSGHGRRGSGHRAEWGWGSFQVFFEAPCLSGPDGLVLAKIFPFELLSSWDEKAWGIYQCIAISGLGWGTPCMVTQV